MMSTDPPPGLPGRYRDTWRRIILDLRAANSLGRATPRAVQALAVAEHQWQEATDLIEQTGTIYDDHGTPKTSPALTVQNQAAQTIAALSRQLGLNRPGQDPDTRPSAPAVPKPGGGPMRAGDDRDTGARWCEEHGRMECRHKRSKGRGQCHGAAITGLDSCRMHAGNKARVEVAKAQSRGPRWMPVPVHPAEALLQEVAWWTGQCAWLDEMVGGLSDGRMVWGMVRRQDVRGGEFPGATIIEEATLNTWVQWQQKAHAMKAQVSRWGLESEAEGRMVRLAEAQGARAFQAFRAGLQRLGLSEEQWAKARETMPQVLKELTAA